MFDELGYAITGWTVFENNIYYTDASGKVTKGWFETDGKKYLAMDDLLQNELALNEAVQIARALVNTSLEHLND